MFDNNITLRKKVAQLEAELQTTKSETTKYRKFFELSSDALSVIDATSGKFIECNQSAIDMYGVVAESDFLDLSISDISPSRQPCGAFSEQLAHNYIKRALTEGSQVFQWVHSKLDGTTFPCLVSLSANGHGEQRYVLAITRDLSEVEDIRKSLGQYQTAYLEEKEKFERFFNLIPIGLTISRKSDEEFEYVNAEFCRLSGYKLDELHQMTCSQLASKLFHEDEQVKIEARQNSGSDGPHRKQCIHKSGKLFPVMLSRTHVTTSTGQEYLWSIIQDISRQHEIECEAKKTKEQAESNELRLKIANDSAGIGVWEWDLTNNSLHWDKWMYALYGINQTDFSGAYQAWENSVHPDDLERARTALHSAVEGKGTYAPEFRVVHPNGQVRIMKASAEIIKDENDKAIRVVGVNYDITEKNTMLIELEKAKQTAEDANQSKDIFLANMSHEIRTPLNAILGALQLLKQQNLSNQLSTIVGNASSSAKSLITIINDILDYSKIAENKLTLEHEPFSFLEVVEGIKFDVGTLVNTKGITLESIIDPSFEDKWIGDSVRVKQILLNLVSNAVKFTEKGSVKIVVKRCKSGGRPAICFNVIDTGIGMSKEVQSRVFNRFVQADSSTTRMFGGTGLGMSITMCLIQMMGGNINLNSEPDVGTDIYVVLPLSQSHIVSKETSIQPVTTPSLLGKKILVAEDNDVNQLVIETMLQTTEAEITLVKNGQQAVNKASNNEFDLVLMDIQMPVMDGVEAMLKINDLNLNIPIVALTANVMPVEVKRYLELGFTEHLGKPVEIEMLYGLLHRIFSIQD